MCRPGVQVKTVKGNPLAANGDFGQMRPNLSIEAVSVHAEIAGRIAQPDKTWQQARILTRHSGDI